MLELLDLLAQGAPEEALARPAAEAEAAGADPAELAELRAATETALGIHRTIDRHRRRESRLTALFDTAGDLAALRDPDAVLRAIVHRAKLLLGTDVTYLSLNDDEAGDTYMRVTDGSVAVAFQQVRLGMGQGLGGLVAQTARPYATGDYRTDTRFRHTGTIDHAVREEGLRAILGVPLRLGTRVIGVLYAADRTPRTFTPDEIALLSSLADHAAIAIDGARLMEETRAQSEALRRAEEAHDRLTDLVLRGGDVTDVAARTAAILDAGILVHDADGTELARSAAGPVPPTGPAVAASRTAGRAVPLDGSPGTWVCAVLAGPEILGSIALTGRPRLADADRLLFERAAVVTALLLLLRRSVAATEDRLRGELLGDLLAVTGDPAGLAGRARRLGIDLSRPHGVLAAHAGTVPRDRLLGAAARAARALGGLAGLHHGQVVLVVPAPDPGAAARSLAADLGQATGDAVTVGAAGPATGPADLPAAHTEARRCLAALRALGRAGDGAAPADLGFVGVLLGDGQGVAGYVRDTLGPVLDYDTGRGTELTATLEAYFAHGGSLTRTKDVLHVHVNTVVQRLDRIARLLGADWNSPSRALELQLALRLFRLTHAIDSGK
ncbi:GAF domain-containing protein [Streptomyces sp. NPDC089799]|uniref:helix-turn-helix domain-containing protein n=1 Tax=Streptomyces sp. NPDC089799 TaxID=3155066 RepID=UPI00342FA014